MTKKSYIKHMVEDPYPDVTGVLLSDVLELYIEKANMIEHVDLPCCLAPASYNLRIGDEYWIMGKKLELGEGSSTEIPPFGFIYVKSFEKLRLPIYMVGRINIRVKQGFKGLLLATGPQVDPGFVGHLYFPLHNFSSSSVKLEYKDKIVTIDFLKTSKVTSDNKKLRSLWEDNILDHLEGCEGKSILLFDKDNWDRDFLSYFKDGPPARSALEEQAEELQKFYDNIEARLDKEEDKLKELGKELIEADRFRTVMQAIVILVIVGLMLGLFYWFDAKYDSLVERFVQFTEKII